MTTPARRAALALVGERSLTDAASGDDWRAEAVARQWEPEHQLIGALMWLTAAQARPILELVPATAIRGPATQWAYELIRALVDDDRDPDPVVVLAAAKHRPHRRALHPEQPPTPARHRDFGLYLFEAYSQTVSPAAAASYAREVLDDAYRRAVGEHGIRLQQLAGSGADRDQLTEHLSAMRAELAEWWRRAEHAATPGWWHLEPTSASVPAAGSSDR